MHANAVDFGKAVVECGGVVGIHLPQCGARMADTRCNSLVHRLPPSFEIPSLQSSLTSFSVLSLSGHTLVKLGQSVHTLTRSASLTDYEHVARSVGLDPFRMLQMARLPATVLDDPNLMISADSVGWLLEETARLSGQEAFGLLLAETRSPAIARRCCTVMRRRCLMP
ncbi:AraC family transcriptional regulator ligand-binding domain-containing protein [Caballeronia sp.]|uniref:AraC family transcriptional regulator ligand-binding domain-containing protein n=1 Tax=Caballeronia sp. TaxID=1931223 RepID=UPI003C619882